MVASELGACEWFVWDLRRSNLIDRGRLDQVVSEYLQKNPRAEPPQLAEYLLQQGILTPFQSERLLQGKTQGFVLGPFTLMDALGAGSLGTVYKAQSKTDNNWYAVKVLPRRSMWNVRIARRKVRLFEQTRHPAVIPFVDVGTSGGMHYLAWPLVEGETLDKRITEHGKLTPGFAAHLALQVAEGLDICHQQGIIHGLLKPSNLMLGADDQVFILDFGIGCLLAETEGESLVDTMSTANAVTSGLDCASPESIMDPSNLTPPGDQYSLGCTLYYLVTGQYPFPDGNAADKMMAHQFKQPKPVQELNPDVPPKLIEIIDRLMQKSPEQRYHSTTEVVEALRPLATKEGGALPRPVAARASANGLSKPAAQAAPPKSSSGFGGGRTKPAAPASREPGKSAPSRPVTIAPSSPTPRPKSVGSLPTRDSLRGGGSNRPATMMASPSHLPSIEPPSSHHDEPSSHHDEPRSHHSEPRSHHSEPRSHHSEPRSHHSEPRRIPGDFSDEAEQASWDERLGPVGIAVAAGVACAAVYFLTVILRIF